MFTYDPKQASNAWPIKNDDGRPIVFDAAIKSVKEGISKKSGGEMLTISFTVWNEDGKTKTIDDYITAKAVFKLKQIAKALGRSAEFDAGSFDLENYVGSSVSVHLKIEEYNGEDSNKIDKVFAASTDSTPAAPSPAPSPEPPPAKQPISAFRPPKREAVTSPISDDPHFADADIPF
jgi:hypothetical protein